MLTSKFSVLVKNHFATILLLLFLVSEAFSKYNIYYENEKSDIPRLIKFVVFTFLIFSLIKNFKSLLAPFLLASMFCIGQLFLVDGFKLEILTSGAKLLFPIFLFILVNKYPLKESPRKLLFQVFEYVLIVNGILILIGLFLDIHLFDSYRWGRFGYNGLFITSSTSSYVYAIAIFYFLLKLKKDFLKSWKTFFVIVCALLTGTKILYIAIVGSLLIYLVHFVNFNKSYRRILIIGLTTVVSFIGYFFFFRYGIFNQIRQEQGLISAILSFRDDLLLEQTLPFIQENWRWYNYLFGGISDLAIRSQMGFIDIFLFLGIIGGLVYLFTFYKTFASKSPTKVGVYIILILVLMVFLSGNFFENASVAIYLLILKETISHNESTL